MTDERTVELINREIDGLNSIEETRDLRDRLPEDPEAQEMYEDLVKLRSMLKSVPAVEPPSYLKPAIINSIPFRKPTAAGVRAAGRVRHFLASFRLNTTPAITFAVGLALGIVAITLFAGDPFTSRPADLSNLYGTMMLSDFAWKLPVADEKTFEIGDIQATATIRASKTLVLAEFHFKSRGDFQIGLDYAEDAIGFSSFGQTNTSPNNLSVNRSAISISGNGENQYVVVFNRKSPKGFALRFSASRSGSPVYESNLSVAAVSQN